MMTHERLRAPIVWVGGKGRMVSKLVPLIPAGGRPYVEPFMGAASLFFAREPAPVEILNDIDGELVNLFRCLQDRSAFDELRHRLMWTPYARAEYARALEIRRSGTGTPVDRAWAYFVVQNMGMGGFRNTTIGSWGRTFTTSGGMADTTNRWLMRLSMLDAWHWRLMRVQIDQRDAIEVIQYWDNRDAIFYVDPPYHPDTRVTQDCYLSEPHADYHDRLVEVLLAAQGAVVVSGYDHQIYRRLDEAGWVRHEWRTACSAAGRVRGSRLRGAGAALAMVPRTEVAWQNPRAIELLRHSIAAR